MKRALFGVLTLAITLISTAAQAGYPSFVLYQHPHFDIDDFIIERGKRDEIRGWNLYDKELVLHTKSGNDVSISFYSNFTRDLFEYYLTDEYEVDLTRCSPKMGPPKTEEYTSHAWTGNATSCTKSTYEITGFTCVAANSVKTINPYKIFLAQYDDTDLKKTPLIHIEMDAACEARRAKPLLP